MSAIFILNEVVFVSLEHLSAHSANIMGIDSRMGAGTACAGIT